PWRAGARVQPAARPAVRRGAQGSAGAGSPAAGDRRAERRAGCRPQQHRPAQPQVLADGAGGDQVLPERTRHRRGALGRQAEPGPAARALHQAAAGLAPAHPRMTARTRMTGGRQAAAAGLLGAACCAWAAWPLTGTLPTVLLVVAAVFVLADLIRLAGVGLPLDQVDAFSSLGLRAARWTYTLISEVPAAECAALAALIVEATHHSRPWHTGLLGAALLCYLLATHLAESRARLRVLRPQLPALA